MSSMTHNLRYQGHDLELSVERDGETMEITLEGRPLTTRRIASGPGPTVIEVDGRHERGVVHVDADRISVAYGGRTWVLERTTPGAAAIDVAPGTAADIQSPMTGTVLEVLCAEGDTVAPGTALVVVEAMKMEHRLKAEGAATVTSVLVEAGQQVDIGQTMVTLEPTE